MTTLSLLGLINIYIIFSLSLSFFFSLFFFSLSPFFSLSLSFFLSFFSLSLSISLYLVSDLIVQSLTLKRFLILFKLIWKINFEFPSNIDNLGSTNYKYLSCNFVYKLKQLINDQSDSCKCQEFNIRHRNITIHL